MVSRITFMYLHRAHLLHCSQCDRWLVDITRLLQYRLAHVRLFKNPTSFELCAVHSSISHFQTALLEITLSGRVLRNWASYLALSKKRLKNRLCLDKDSSPPVDLLTLTQLPTSYTQTGPRPSGGTLQLWSRAPSPECQNRPLLSEKKKKEKCQMPLAHTVQGHWRIITRTVTETTGT